MKKWKAVLASMTALFMSVNTTYALEGNTPPEPPSGQTGQPGGTPPSGMPGGANTQEYDYTGTLSGSVTADNETLNVDGQSLESTEADVNVALASNGGTLNISNSSLTKSGDDQNGDACNFYGINSIALSVNDSSKLVISDSTLTATSVGSNAVFATDSGTAYVYNTEITTSADNSRGLDATYGGTIVASNVKISTKGEHCASLATDRGGGNISVSDSNLQTEGSGSPLLYSTGDIEVDNVTGTASGSQISGMEGLNTILIAKSELTSTITSATASDPIANGVILYQSTSGDAETSTGESAVFQAVDSTLSSYIESGAMFYVTNTNVHVYLENDTINFDSSKAKLFYIAGNDSNNWGTAGSNGASVVLTAVKQTLQGDIVVDTISSLDAYLTNGSTYTGAIGIETNAVNTSAKDVNATMNIDATSKWVVTGDSTVNCLNVENGGTIVDESGNPVTIIVNGETFVEGTSEYTVTVTNSYSESVALGSANALTEKAIDTTEFTEMFSSQETTETETEAVEQPVEEAEQETTVEETSETSASPVGILAAVGVGVAALIAVMMRRKIESK